MPQSTRLLGLVGPDMAKGDAHSPTTMDPFSPAHQTDEGYSEDPLNPTLPQNLPAPRSLADLPSWLAIHVSALPLPVRTGQWLCPTTHPLTCAYTDLVPQS